MNVKVIIRKLENGNHISRKCIGTVSETIYALPDAECKERRPDWAEYQPLVTFRAIERALKVRGLLPPLDSDKRYYLSVA